MSKMTQPKEKTVTFTGENIKFLKMQRKIDQILSMRPVERAEKKRKF